MRTARSTRALVVFALFSGAVSACTLLTDLSGLDEGQADPPEVEASAESAPAVDAPMVDVSTADAATDTDALDATVEAEAGIDACPPVAVDLTSDPEHCGACGHTCFGGACTGSKCMPVTIISGLPVTNGLAVAGGRLYVSAPPYVRQYLLDGGGGIDVAPSPSPKYLAADGTYLYWPDAIESNLKRWPLAGGGVDTLVIEAGALGIGASSTHLYFTHYSSEGGVERVLLDGGGRETVFDSYNHPEDVDFANGELIVGGDGVNELAVFADAGFGAKRVLSSGFGPCTMSVKGSDVYFGEQISGNILRVPLAGGGKELLASGAPGTTGVAVTNDSIYWRNNNDGGTIRRLAR